MTLATYADVEQLLIGWAPTITTLRALTETPADLDTLLATTPVMRITRIGGATIAPGIDFPTVDFDCFGLTRPAAKGFAIQMMTAVDLHLSGYTNFYGTVNETAIRSGVAWRPWENPNIRRFGFTAALAVHSHI